MSTFETFYQQGLNYFNQENYRMAAECFTKAIPLARNDYDLAGCYRSRGSSYGAMEDDRIIADYKMAADYGDTVALDGLRQLNINYTPQKRSAPSNATSFFGGSQPSYQYGAINHHFVDNGAGDIMLVMEAPAGSPQEAIAKFIYDGSSDVMLIRNNIQVIYLPSVPENFSRLIRSCKVVLVGEKQGYDIQIILDSIRQQKFPQNYFSAIYNAQIDVINRSLPIPPNDLKAVRAMYGLK